MTLEALRWLHDAKAAFIHLDHDGTILTASIGGLDDARLRRAQALLPNTEHRLTIARELLEAKIKGQLAVLDSFGLHGAEAVREALALLDRADRIESRLIAEAKAAEAYWDAWADVPMEFARRDRVPDHWRTFGMRRSPADAATSQCGQSAECDPELPVHAAGGGDAHCADRAVASIRASRSSTQTKQIGKALPRT